MGSKTSKIRKKKDDLWKHQIIYSKGNEKKGKGMAAATNVALNRKRRCKYVYVYVFILKFYLPLVLVYMYLQLRYEEKYIPLDSHKQQMLV